VSWWINDLGEVRDLDQPGQPIIDDGHGNDGEDD
jgi:hypothetical protein